MSTIITRKWLCEFFENEKISAQSFLLFDSIVCTPQLIIGQYPRNIFDNLANFDHNKEENIKHMNSINIHEFTAAFLNNHKLLGRCYILTEFAKWGEEEEYFPMLTIISILYKRHKSVDFIFIITNMIMDTLSLTLVNSYNTITLYNLFLCVIFLEEMISVVAQQKSYILKVRKRAFALLHKNLENIEPTMFFKNCVTHFYNYNEKLGLTRNNVAYIDIKMQRLLVHFQAYIEYQKCQNTSVVKKSKT